MGLAWYPVILPLLLIVVGLLAATGYGLIKGPDESEGRSAHG